MKDPTEVKDGMHEERARHQLKDRERDAIKVSRIVELIRLQNHSPKHLRLFCRCLTSKKSQLQSFCSVHARAVDLLFEAARHGENR